MSRARNFVRFHARSAFICGLCEMTVFVESHRIFHAPRHQVKKLNRVGSTLITSQLPIDTWHDVIGEPTFADASLDRLIHNAYRADLDGQSMRKTKIKTGDENSHN